MKFYLKLQKKNTNLTESVCDMHITFFSTNAYQNVSLWCAYNILQYKCLPECVFYWPQSIWKALYILSLCNNPFRKSGTALPPLVHQVHVCTSTLTSTLFYSLWGSWRVLRVQECKHWRRVHLPAPEVCRVLPPASSSSASPAVLMPPWKLKLKHFSPWTSGICWHAYLPSALTTGFTGMVSTS